MPEHKNYTEVYKQFHHVGFEIVSVSLDSDKVQWKKAMVKDKIVWTSRSDQKNEISTYTYLVSAIPKNYLIGSDGKIIAKDIRGKELNAKLSELFSK